MMDSNSTAGSPLANLSTPRKSSVSGGSLRVEKIAVKSTRVEIWAGSMGAAAPHPSFPKVREETKVCPAVNPSEAKALRHSVASITSSMPESLKQPFPLNVSTR